MPILAADHGTPAQRAGFVQRPPQVHRTGVVVPAAGTDRGRTLEFACRAFAHQVDGAARRPRPLAQAGRAAHDFQAVVHGQRARRQRRLLVFHGQAVDHQVVDLEAARGKTVALAAPLAHRQAGGGLHGVGQRHQPPVFNLLAGDHGHGLRGLARRQRQGRGGTHPPGGVAASAFRGVAGLGIRRHAHFGQRGPLLVAAARLRLFLQGIAAARARHQLQAAARQQALQSRLGRETARHARTAQSLGQCRVERQRHARCGSHLGQRTAQRACGDLVALGSHGRGRRHGVRRLGRAGRQGTAQQDQPYGVGNRVEDRA